MRIMRRVISPRLAMRILENGGESSSDADDGDTAAENDRLGQRVDRTSMVWGRARCNNNCDDERHLVVLFEIMRAPPLQAVLRIKEDILIITYYSMKMSISYYSASDCLQVFGWPAAVKSMQNSAPSSTNSHCVTD